MKGLSYLDGQPDVKAAIASQQETVQVCVSSTRKQAAGMASRFSLKYTKCYSS